MSHARIHLVLAIVLAHCLGSCGERTDDAVRPADPIPPLPLVQNFEIETIPYHNLACLEQGLPANGQELFLETAPVFRWTDGAISLQHMDVRHLQVKAQPLSSTYVNKVSFSDVFRRQCNTNESGPPNCVKDAVEEPGWAFLEHGQAVRICSSQDGLERKSIEQLALSATIAVESAGRVLAKIIPELSNIKPIQILITPKFESHWTPWSQDGKPSTFVSLLTDNLAYFPTYDASPPFIALFPKQKLENPRANLWESTFITSHEFAHHVERSLDLDRYNVKRSIFRKAVSEGFADIIAFASLSASSSSLRGIPCFGIDRSPDLAEFNTGLPKTIHENLLARVSSQLSGNLSTIESTAEFSFESTVECQGTLPSSAHGMGAIFAHAIFNVSKAAPHYHTAPSKVIVEIAIAWLKNINANLQLHQTNGEANIEVIAKALESSVNEQFHKANIDIPENIRSLLRQKMNFMFPTVKNYVWFQ